ncbi:hypothetical protein, partial [Streptomyces sp. NPDC102462]|uniref:hypothetical protein n=1 Tax=Streptomyces sp. NPDC102462 TaxID=3366178 RepID=UPI00382385FD
GAQLRFTDLDGLRLTCFATNTKGGQLADLELLTRTTLGTFIRAIQPLVNELQGWMAVGEARPPNSHGWGSDSNTRVRVGPSGRCPGHHQSSPTRFGCRVVGGTRDGRAPACRRHSTVSSLGQPPEES